MKGKRERRTIKMGVLKWEYRSERESVCVCVCFKEL